MATWEQLLVVLTMWYKGFGFRDRNRGGASLLDFSNAFELVIAISCFSREDHLDTFRSMVANIQIDFLL